MDQDPSEQIAPDITCREVAEWTSAYLDEHLDAPFKIRIALHVASCAHCRAYLKQIALVRHTLPLLPRPAPSPINRLRLRQQFAASHSH